MPEPASYCRYVALGDSQTEGLNDGDDVTGLRGWADRFAEALAATTSPGLLYANLALRGCRARDVRHGQLDAALALQPDLASVVVGMNDLLRHDYDADATVRDVEETFAALRATGCRVVTMTFPDIGRMLPVMAWLRPREVDLNRRLVEAAVRHDVAVLDLFPLAMCGDPALWSHDRIHGSREGHARIAAGMGELLGLPGSDGSWSASAPSSTGRFHAVRRDAWWAATFVVPFLTRQLLGRGPGTGRSAKRPHLMPVEIPRVRLMDPWPAAPRPARTLAAFASVNAAQPRLPSSAKPPPQRIARYAPDSPGTPEERSHAPDDARDGRHPSDAP